jgi:hypothetical protein
MDKQLLDCLVVLTKKDWFLAVPQSDDSLFQQGDWIIGGMVPFDRPLPISRQLADSLASRHGLQVGSSQAFLEGIRRDAHSMESQESEQKAIRDAASRVADDHPEIPRQQVWSQAQEYFDELFKVLGEIPIRCMEEFLEFRTRQLQYCASQIRAANHGEVPRANLETLNQYLGITADDS